MQPATLDQAHAFAAYMSQKFSARIVRRDDAIEFQIVKAILSAFNLPDFTETLDTKSVTLGPLVYLRNDLSPDDTIRTIAHECAHVKQWGRDGLGFAYFYVTFGEKRVAYEVEGIRAAAEVQFARTKVVPPLDELVSSLKNGYAMSEQDLAFARAMLEVAGTSIAAGIVGTESGRAAIDWLRANTPELLAG